MSGKSWEQKSVLLRNLSDTAEGGYYGCTWSYEHLRIAEYTFSTKVGQDTKNNF